MHGDTSPHLVAGSCLYCLIQESQGAVHRLAYPLWLVSNGGGGVTKTLKYIRLQHLDKPQMVLYCDLGGIVSLTYFSMSVNRRNVSMLCGENREK